MSSTPSPSDSSAKAAGISPGAKLVLDLGPLAVFFIANGKLGIYWATGLFMIASVLALAVSWRIERKLPPMALITLAVVLVFGGLTIWLHDERFIKLKPTIVYTTFALILLTGFVLRKPFLQRLFGSMFALTEAGWRGFTLRWIVFFVLMAVLNEVVWRNTDTDTWVKFKTFGAIPLVLVFSLMQGPFVQKHRLPDVEPRTTPPAL